jgi:hypothetical protein
VRPSAARNPELHAEIDPESMIRWLIFGTPHQYERSLPIISRAWTDVLNVSSRPSPTVAYPTPRVWGPRQLVQSTRQFPPLLDADMCPMGTGGSKRHLPTNKSMQLFHRVFIGLFSVSAGPVIPSGLVLLLIPIYVSGPKLVCGQLAQHLLPRLLPFIHDHTVCPAVRFPVLVYP